MTDDKEPDCTCTHHVQGQHYDYCEVIKFRQRQVDSDSMDEPYLECPECGAMIRARMADSPVSGVGEQP